MTSSFLRPQENVTPDGIMAQLKPPFLFGPVIKTESETTYLDQTFLLYVLRGRRHWFD